MTPPTPTRGEGQPPSLRPAPEQTAARRLIRRLIAVVAAPITPQQRLDRIVSMIAADIVAEVCSVYAQRAGDLLELFATEGLSEKAVHRTRLRVGEGLVGHIAARGQVLNVTEAQEHPDFVYRPETGEEIYHSFLGVPILRSGRVVGVLTVQNKARRHYHDDEVEALEIVATVLAEMFVSGGLVDHLQYADVAGLAPQPRRLEGTRLVAGVAMGPAILHQPRVEVTRLLADDPALEAERLEQAVGELRAVVDEFLARPEIASGEHREVLEAYRMFAHDHGWLQRMREAIRTGLSAEAAVKRIQDETRLRLGQVSDAYLRERLLDLDDLANRLLLHLSGRSRFNEPDDLPEQFILVARSLSPAELVEYDQRLCGAILEEGSHSAHVTIVARALDIPLVGHVEGAMSAIDSGDIIALDADNGQVFLRPGEEVEQAFSASLQVRAEQRRSYASLRDLPTVTRDGIAMDLNINAAFLIDLAQLDDTGAAGVGLYRSELAFMARETYPDTDEQAELYSTVLDRAGGRPVVFRTLDVGSDKLLPYWRFPKEENPAMGWRAVRMALDRPSIMRDQLRALLKAASGRGLKVMFPMIAEVAEFDAARRLLDIEVQRATDRGQTLPVSMDVGTMLEVPALIWQLPALLPRIDFLSIGSNDLMQFLFACDRSNPALIDRYDVLAPAALSFLRDLVQRCRSSGVKLTVCGEMAGRPLEAMALIGLGIRSLSVMPADVGPIKAMLRSLGGSKLSHYLDQLYDLPDHSLRGRLLNYAIDHDVQVSPSSPAGL